jgi:hypothetical protein
MSHRPITLHQLTPRFGNALSPSQAKENVSRKPSNSTQDWRNTIENFGMVDHSRNFERYFI